MTNCPLKVKLHQAQPIIWVQVFVRLGERHSRLLLHVVNLLPASGLAVTSSSRKWSRALIVRNVEHRLDNASGNHPSVVHTVCSAPRTLFHFLDDLLELLNLVLKFMDLLLILPRYFKLVCVPNGSADTRTLRSKRIPLLLETVLVSDLAVHHLNLIIDDVSPL